MNASNDTNDSAASPVVRIFDDAETLARAVAARFVELASDAIEARGRFGVALAGGTTPRRVYQLLASDEWRVRVAWERVHVFFGDERAVAPDDPASNYRMAHEALLAHVSIPPSHVRRMRGEGDASVNARLYEAELRAFFGGQLWPRFDLVLLGMGDDGHTASLFPSTPALAEQSAWVVANRVEKLDATRLTLTAPAINHAAHILLIVTGEAKAERLQQVIEGERDPARLPAQLIRPLDGTLEWFLDKPAAGHLEIP